MKSLLGAALPTLLLASACGGTPPEEQDSYPGEIVTAIGSSYVVDGSNVYYSGAGGVYVHNLDSGATNMLATFSWPRVIATIADNLIVVDDETSPKEIHAVFLSNGTKQLLGTTNAPYSEAVQAVPDGNLIYWLKGGAGMYDVYSAGPGVAETAVALEFEAATTLAIDETKVYVATRDSDVQYADEQPYPGPIMMAPKDGSSTTPVPLHESGGYVAHLAVGGDQLIWSYQVASASWIRRKPLSGALAPLDLEVGEYNVTDLVADAAGAYAIQSGGVLLQIEGDVMRVVTQGAVAPLQLTPEFIYFGCGADQYEQATTLCRLPR